MTLGKKQLEDILNRELNNAESRLKKLIEGVRCEIHGSEATVQKIVSGESVTFVPRVCCSALGSKVEELWKKQKDSN